MAYLPDAASSSSMPPSLLGCGGLTGAEWNTFRDFRLGEYPDWFNSSSDRHSTVVGIFWPELSYNESVGRVNAFRYSLKFVFSTIAMLNMISAVLFFPQDDTSVVDW